MAINCIAVEDEPIALKKLTGFINDTPFLNRVACFDNSIEALNFLSSHTVDLIFLDIQMDKLNGIQLLESLPNPPHVIITSAYNKYALKGYELKVIDYLLKPFSFDRFLQAANKASELITDQKNETKIETAPKIIFVKTAYQIERVVVEDILYVEGMKDYLGIVTPEKRFMCLQNFSSVLAVLPKEDFVRVHKSYIVSLNKIENISNLRIKIGDKLIPISDSYNKSFFASLEKYRRVL